MAVNKNILGTLNSGLRNKSFWIGAGAMAIGIVLWPGIKKSLRPAAVKLAQGSMVVASRAKEVIDSAKENVNKIAKDAQEINKQKYNNYNVEYGQMEPPVINELKLQRDMALDEINMLKEQLNSLYTQIKGAPPGRPYIE